MCASDTEGWPAHRLLEALPQQEINEPIDIIVTFDDDPSMQYPGGKGKTYQHLINLMPPHEVYIETHLGGGAVLRNKKPARRSIGIDCDQRVIDMWKRQPQVVCELVYGRAEDYLASYEFKGQELIYADPPYLPSTRRRERVYSCDYVQADHESLLSSLCALPCKVMISGYANALYEEFLADWNKASFNAMTHTGIRQETVWFNFETPAQLHDPSYIGNSFRHRQTVKRRFQRWKAKLAEMDPVERHALIDWLDETYTRREVM